MPSSNAWKATMVAVLLANVVVLGVLLKAVKDQPPCARGGAPQPAELLGESTSTAASLLSASRLPFVLQVLRTSEQCTSDVKEENRLTKDACIMSFQNTCGLEITGNNEYKLGKCSLAYLRACCMFI
jgi:hypothetical protein